MGIISKKGTSVEKKVCLFSGTPRILNSSEHNNLQGKDQEWVTITSQTISKVFQNIVPERTAKSATTPMQTDLNMFSTKKNANVELVINQNGAQVTSDLG